MENTPPIKPVVERSVSIVEIAKALSKFQSSISNVTKDEENPFFKSSYASLGNIIDTIRKPLGDNSLSFAQFPIEDNRLVTLLMHTSGEYFQSVLRMNPKDGTPQSQGSAITYARRYALSAILGIATEDDDGNAASAPKTPPVTVKAGKIGSQEDFSKAALAIEKYTTIAQLEDAREKLDKSSKFTDGQKDELERLISGKVDLLTVKYEKEQ